MDRIAAFDDPKLPRTEVSLSRVETGQQIYTERLLMALAEVYQVEPWELLTRNPFKDGQIFDLLPRLNEKQMERATALIEALLKTG
jgi:transcriptional regulator with XRE-family HTH domain